MGVWFEQWDAFYRLCDSNDKAILNGEKEIQLEDYERLTYIAFVLGYAEVMQILLERYPELTDRSLAQFSGTVGVLNEYPEYFLDEELCRKYDQWTKEFMERMTEEERAYFRWRLE